MRRAKKRARRLRRRTNKRARRRLVDPQREEQRIQMLEGIVSDLDAMDAFESRLTR